MKIPTALLIDCLVAAGADETEVSAPTVERLISAIASRPGDRNQYLANELHEVTHDGTDHLPEPTESASDACVGGDCDDCAGCDSYDLD